MHQLRWFVPPSFSTYYEPFLGGAAFFFALAYSPSIIGDANGELLAMYRAVRDFPEALIAELDRLQPYVLDPSRYYQIRAAVSEELTPAAHAARFIYLNKTCYNGLYRVNRSGRFNVPFGRYKVAPRLYSPDNLLHASRLLQGAEIRRGDFEDTLRDAQRGDFVYLDPPYSPLSATSNFTRYTAQSFGEPEQERLARCYQSLDAQGCQVLLSNSDTPLVRELYSGLRTEIVQAPRNINRDPDGRGAVAELAIRNY